MIRAFLSLTSTDDGPRFQIEAFDGADREARTYTLDGQGAAEALTRLHDLQATDFPSSSSLDFPEEYGVSQKTVDAFLDAIFPAA